MIFDRFILMVFNLFGHCDFVDRHFRMGRYCVFCHTFRMDLNHLSEATQMRHPTCD